MQLMDLEPMVVEERAQELPPLIPPHLVPDEDEDPNRIQISDEEKEGDPQEYQEKSQEGREGDLDHDADHDPDAEQEYEDDGEEGEEEEQQPIDDTAADEEDAMQEYLRREQEYLAWCEESGVQWIDREFPCDLSQFYREKLPVWAQDLGQIEWRRPHQLQKEARFMDKEGEFELKQGVFAESTFVGALATIATKQDLLDRLIVSSSHFQKGFVTFQFFKNGKWVQVTVDTLLPYEKEANSRVSVYSCCANASEFWVQLMEKAYSKLHGCYQVICGVSIGQALVDLSGGVSQNLKLHQFQQAKKQQHMNQVWHNLQFYFNQKFLINCILEVEGKSPKNSDTGHSGILQNHFYPIVDIRDLAKQQLKLIRIRNPYGNEGVWTGPFSEDSQDWDKHRNLKEQLKVTNSKVSKKQQGSWWMNFSDWLLNYSTLYISKVFPQSWQTYSIEGRWQGKTNGGPCPQPVVAKAVEHSQDQDDKLKKSKAKSGFRSKSPGKKKQKKKISYQQPDTDDRWFNNPQYRIRVVKDTKLYISLMLEDERITKQSYAQTNFMVIANRNRRNRVWERPPSSDIIVQANQAGTIPAQRQLTTFIVLKRFPGKKQGYYTVIPNLHTQANKKDQKRNFFLRIFASEQIDVIQLPQTLEHSQEGNWTQQSAGGRRRMIDQKQKIIKDNPAWCMNPQYFMNLQKPTHLKIILRKTGQTKRVKHIKPGMTICRFQTPITPQTAVKTTKVLERSDSRKKIDPIQRLLQQTSLQLKPPIMQNIQRKLAIIPQQKFRESQYLVDEYSALYFFWNPTQGPFIIIPSLQEKKTLSFKLTIFSNNPVHVERLDQSRNAVMVGKWEASFSAGGCHLKKDWLINPKYILTFGDLQGRATLKIKLAIADKSWKKINSNTVKGMLGIYLLQKKEGKIEKTDILEKTNFLPVQMIEMVVELGVKSRISKDGYIIMPCTYEEKVHGSFILSVSCDRPIKLTSYK